jgi:hypothetical protein
LKSERHALQLCLTAPTPEHPVVVPALEHRAAASSAPKRPAAEPWAPPHLEAAGSVLRHAKDRLWRPRIKEKIRDKD